MRFDSWSNDYVFWTTSFFGWYSSPDQRDTVLKSVSKKILHLTFVSQNSMMRIVYTLLMGVFLGFTGYSQEFDMKPGFSALEDGEWEKARSFFEEILGQDRSNRTARLCYARAVGLGGAPDTALVLFEKLLGDYPEDYEIKLNRAEALLWNKKFDIALPVYQHLFGEDSASFPAVLGYANTLSSLKQYQQALTYVNLALTLSPKNPNALLSKKYILLGLADYDRRNWQFRRSEALLDSLLTIFPNDRNALLSKAGLYLSENKPSKAAKEFESLLNFDPLEGNLGLSYVSILKQNPKKSLEYAQNAEHWVSASDTTNIARINMSKIQALVMAGNYQKAISELSNYQKSLDDGSQVELAKARLRTWLQEYDVAESILQERIQRMPTNFEAFMSLAEIYRATHQYDLARDQIEHALTLEPNQPDAIRVLQRLKLSDRPSLSFESSYLEDSGNNSIITSDLRFSLGRFKKWRPFGSLRFHQSGQDQIDLSANFANINLGSDYQIGAFSKLYSEIGIQPKFLGGKRSGSLLTGSIRGLRQIGKYFSLELVLQKTYHNYTVALVENSIGMLDKGLNLNFSHPKGPGVFAQYMHTGQADENNRNLVFLSGFYRMIRLPLVKGGFNYLTFRYADQVSDYFSPGKYDMLEVFINANTIDHLRSRWRIDLLLAAGKQKIEDGVKENTQRLELTVGNQLSDNFFASLYFKYSNAAQFNTLGFRSNRYGLQLNYSLPVSKQIVSWEPEK